MNSDWNTAIVVDPRFLQEQEKKFKDQQEKTQHSERVNVVLFIFSSLLVLSLLVSYFNMMSVRYRVGSLKEGLKNSHTELQECREGADINADALSTLSKAHQDVLSATSRVKSMGDQTWGKRFTVTQYVPSAGGINADSDKYTTSTMWSADPRLRIVAVDPSIIPYGSWVWVEDLGWFQAQDCGGAIKGFRVDVMASSTASAKKFGKREKFVIVVPNA